MHEKRKIVVMGVAGCGKSTVGAALADALNARFQDADDLHPPGNIAKMSAGIALTDVDRWPWLDAVGAALSRDDLGVVCACSALKESYRAHLRSIAGPLAFVWIKAPRALLQTRLAARAGHPFNPVLLDSQLATLEPPSDAIVIDAENTVEQNIARVLAALKATQL